MPVLAGFAKLLARGIVVLSIDEICLLEKRVILSLSDICQRQPQQVVATKLIQQFTNPELVLFQ